MYHIDETQDREKYILLIPAMLDAHFPLLKYAFYSPDYHPVILENEENITDVGLKYVNNDMCYPAVLNVGQMVAALQSGKYDPERTRLLMPTVGDACRGSNYTSVLRRGVAAAGVEQVKVLSLNLKGLEKGEQLKLRPDMVWRALFGLFYGDLLMLLLHQTRPYEEKPGEAQCLWQKWIDRLGEDLRTGRHLNIHHMKRNFYRIAGEFAALDRQTVKKQRIGIVGELYIKYCHIGNWDMIRFLEEQGCETHTNGLSWYAMYYMDSHMAQSRTLEGMLYRIGLWFFGNIQDQMIRALKQYGFYTLEPFRVLKKEAEPYVSYHYNVGDGWLIGAEIVGHILHDCSKVAAVQPFGCMPNHTCGRGLYPFLQRKLPQGQIVSADVDSSGSRLNVYNRIRMLVDL